MRACLGVLTPSSSGMRAVGHYVLASVCMYEFEQVHACARQAHACTHLKGLG